MRPTPPSAKSWFIALTIGLIGPATACRDSGVASNDEGSGTRAPSSRSEGSLPNELVSKDPSKAEQCCAEGEPVDAEPEVPVVPYVDVDVNHVLVTGQSNSIANGGSPYLTSTQPYSNLMFDTGVMPMTNCDGAGCLSFQPPSSFVPLVEGDSFFYPVETSGAGIANEITMLGMDRPSAVDHTVLISTHGRSGNTYWCLRKGSCNYKTGYVVPFEQAMMEVTAARNLAAAAQKSYVVRAVAAIHGESDHYSYTDGTQEFPLDGTDGTPGKIRNYADGLIEWQEDYESSVKAITGQTIPVPLFISQISGWNDSEYSKVAQFQLDAHLRAPRKVILIGPAYVVPITDDCLHYTAHGQRQLGEYFAKAYARVVFDGKPWEPLRPKTVTREGAVITVKFLVPVPPLAIDTDRVAPIANFGFRYTDASGAPPSITNVALSGPDTVTITLASPPTGGARRLTYAQNQIPGTCIGPAGARGNLRDSDETPSKYGYELFNWAVHFGIDVP